MNKNKATRLVALSLGSVLCFGATASFVGCGDSPLKANKDALVVMTEDLNGLFSPFFSTTGTDMEIVGQTQIGMLTTDKNGNLAWGADEAVVTLDYETKKSADGKETEYYFVLKNGIQFSDGEPLTMNDVLFNMYVYLDPTYTGSTTMYSTDIVGLSRYRTQKNVTNDEQDDLLNQTAASRAADRLQALVELFRETGKTPTNGIYDATPEKMRAAIETYAPPHGYKVAIAPKAEISDEDARKQVKEDYEQALKLFKEELERDYESAKTAYIEEPYKSRPEFKNEILCFMYMEGMVNVEYEQLQGQKLNRNKIVKVTPGYNEKTINTKEKAIEHVYNTKVRSEFDQILNYWATGATLETEFVGKAKDVVNHETLADSDNATIDVYGTKLAFASIEGITSLGHDSNDATVKVNGTDYKVAHEHNEDGTVKNADEYDVLKIRINGTDPKAQWNFAFTVAPYHYYSNPAKYPINISEKKFGVHWSDFDYMKKVIQGDNANGVPKNKIPVGAGPYVATSESGSDTPGINDFYANNFVNFKANSRFLLHEPYIKRLRYKVISSTNALGNLENGEAHFVEPQFTKENSETIDKLKARGADSVSTWQLGYGYIGVNAGKIADINLRKAIMAAMNPRTALQFYSMGMAVNIAWPMSAVSWAYPRLPGTSYDGARPTSNMDNDNAKQGRDYMTFTNDKTAKATIEKYMKAAGVSAGDSRLKVTFTIAGADLTQHPIYLVFKDAMDLLNECGWSVEVVPDRNALTKLASGSLSVWAAAWGSTIDPDMYQVYHKNSTATSVLSWGYREIRTGTSYVTEKRILNEMSELIDDARETDVQSTRAAIYKQAMGYVLDLAVEYPIYQRQTLYAYNANVIDVTSLPAEINSYTSPLSKIWDVKFTAD